MKTLFRTLSTLLLTLLLFSCSEQEEITSPDSVNPSKPAGSTSQLSISSISPAAAEIGDVITIIGANFGASKLSTSSVTIKGITATVFVTWTSTSISVLVPSGTVPGPGTVVVKLKTKSSNAVNFTLLPSSPVTIGNQVWMGSNLDIAVYRNNDPIPQITDSAAWHNATSAGWCYYNNDPVLGSIYGKLYNWYAVNDSRGLAPTGWHIPSDAEWRELSLSLGMSLTDANAYPGYFGTDEGGKMKEAGRSLWLSPNTGATNTSGFVALPGGMRHANPAFDFAYKTTFAGWWSATEVPQDSAWCRGVTYNVATTLRNTLSKKNGFSIRCVRDN